MERNLHHKWALWIGIITHTVGFALLIVHRIIAPFYTSHYTPPPTDWVYLAMSCLAAPLLEELAFRSTRFCFIGTMDKKMVMRIFRYKL